jgi:hypothetical protein
VDECGDMFAELLIVGIAPRRYTDAIAMPARENLDGSILRFVRSEPPPRLAITSAYLEAEEVETG